MQDATAELGGAVRRIADLPGPRRWPLVGNLFQMRASRVHQDMERWSRKYGALFRVSVPGVTMLILSDHELIAQVLRQRPALFRRPAVTAAAGAEMGGIPGVFEAEGVQWRNQRRMVMQAFAPTAVKAYFPALVTVAQRLERRWLQKAADQRPLDLGAELRLYTVDIVTGLAFGTDFNTIETGDNAIQRHLDELLPAVARRSIAPFPYWRYFKLPQDRRLERSVKAVHQAVGEVMALAKERLRTDPGRAAQPRNMLEAMLVAAAMPDSGVSERDVAGNVITVLLAGEDTTSNALAWLIFLLHRHPAALARAREEVLRIAPDLAALTVEQVDALVYLDACAQEAMRLKPPAAYIPVEALADTVVADVQVPKGTIIWCVMRHHSMMDEYMRQAASFAPERWLAPDINHKVSMPFGSGPRTCPGRYLALLEMKVAMAMLLARFDIVLVAPENGGEPEEKMGFVMAPERLALRLRAR